MQLGSDSFRRTMRYVGLAASLCIAAMLAAGCGSSKSGGDATTAAKLKGAPIKIGFLHIDSGASGNPQAVYGQQAATARINKTGINGHPLEVVDCHGDGTPEKDIACANQFVGEGVVAVLEAFDNAAGAALPILHSAKIPLVGVAAFSPQTRVDPKSYYFGPETTALSIAPFQTYQKQGLRHAAYAVPNIPAAKYIVDPLQRAAARYGLKFTPVYYPAASPNFATLATSMAATGADVAGTLGLPDEGQCASFVRALRDAGFNKTIYAGFCTLFASQLGAQAAGAEFLTSVWLPAMKRYAPAGVQPQLAQAESDLTGVADASKQGYYSYATYSMFRTFAGVIAPIGGITKASVTTALKDIKDVQSFIGPKITCDRTAWPGTAACTTDMIVGKANGDGTVTPFGGGFISVAPEN